MLGLTVAHTRATATAYDERTGKQKTRFALHTMLKSARFRFLAIAVMCLFAVSVAWGSGALADQIVTPNGVPVITITSAGGHVTIFQSNDTDVHALSGLNNIKVTRFLVNQATHSRVMLPPSQTRLLGRRGWRTFRVAPRQFFIPNVSGRNDGISIENPGGDVAIGVSKRLGALFINAQSGDVSIEKLRGPYVIVGSEGTVRLQNVAGHGIIRTSSGNIELVGVGGDVHIQTATGSVTARASFAERADVVSQGGSIDWRFARVGAGAYRFRSTDGTIRLGFRPGVAALVDAQSGQGSVQSSFDAASAQIRFSSPHALSLAVNGGGPEITAASMSGDIIIEPVIQVKKP